MRAGRVHRVYHVMNVGELRRELDGLPYDRPVEIRTLGCSRRYVLIRARAEEPGNDAVVLTAGVHELLC